MPRDAVTSMVEDANSPWHRPSAVRPPVSDGLRAHEPLRRHPGESNYLSRTTLIRTHSMTAIATNIRPTTVVATAMRATFVMTVWLPT